MIKTFKHKGLEAFFTEDSKRLLNPQHAGRIQRILDLLNDAAAVEELNIPGYGFHPLKGERKSEWSRKSLATGGSHFGSMAATPST